MRCLECSCVREQAVSDAELVGDHRSHRIGHFQLLPQIAHDDPQILDPRVFFAAPGRCEDPVMGHHTPGHFFGKPDMTKYLGGSDVGFAIPGLGYFYGSNLTPHDEKGLGKWSTAEIVTALRTGERPDGRILAPVMPWMSFAKLTDDDAFAIAAFLKSMPPVDNQSPPATGWGETPVSYTHLDVYKRQVDNRGRQTQPWPRKSRPPNQR